MPVMELQRAPASETSHVKNLIMSLVETVDSILGCSWVLTRFKDEPGELSRTLEELAIDPFIQKDVKRYKKQKARAAVEDALAEYAKRSQNLVQGTFAKARWHRVPLGDYDRKVPIFALSRSLEIRARIPEAKFEVEELWFEKRYDPFLVVSYGRERFYIDVWDEQDFETRT